MSEIDYSKVQLWAARRLSEQQIADVMDIGLPELKKDRDKMHLFREAMRIGRAKGEAELRGALYQRAKKGDASAYNELMRLSASKD